MNSHLTPQQMLAYLDGELCRSETRHADDHLHSCWTCLTELERLKGDIATILDAQNQSFSPSLPRPPLPWLPFGAILARSVPLHPARLWMRFGIDLKAVLSPVRILMVSGIIAVALIGAYSVLKAKPVSAQEVMRRIQIADTQRSAITKDQVIRERVHIRKRTRGQNRPLSTSVDTWKSPTAGYWNVADVDSDAADLRIRYEKHAIPIALPLSAASIDAWGKEAGGSPTVSQEGSDIDLSIAGSLDGIAGSVERVSFIVQPKIWRVKQMTLDFSDSSFEVTEDDYSVLPKTAVPAELLAHIEPIAPPSMLARPGVRPVSRIGEAFVHLPTVNLDKAELDAFATLHRLQADLGEPVTIARSGQSVQVGVWQLPPGRQSELRAAFADQPSVRVDLVAPHSSAQNALAVRDTSSQPPDSNHSPLHIEAEADRNDQRLLKFFGTAEREQDFTDSALATSGGVLSHLYALRKLQGQFTSQREQALDSEERAKLDALVQDHLSAVSTGVDDLGRQLRPLDAHFRVTPTTSSVDPVAKTWQERSLEALETARTVDHLLRALLTTSQTPATPDSALPEIDRNLGRIRAESTISARTSIN